MRRLIVILGLALSLAMPVAASALSMTQTYFLVDNGTCHTTWTTAISVTLRGTTVTTTIRALRDDNNAVVASASIVGTTMPTVAQINAKIAAVAAAAELVCGDGLNVPLPL